MFNETAENQRQASACGKVDAYDSPWIFVGKEYICNNMEYIVFAPSLIYEDVWE